MYDMHNDVEMIWKGWKGNKEKEMHVRQVHPKCLLINAFYNVALLD